MRRISITDPGTVLVVHDELDLEPGRLQLKVGGGLAGHNGLRSIADVLSSNEFPRLRIGIGKPERKEQVTDWVLRRPTGTMRESLLIDTNEAADALEAVIDFGLEEAQRRVNAARRD
jgi:PTH1 family peptidyl-tRNA hydrolase